MEFSPTSTAKVICLNQGKLVGKTRFQKSVYFLEELGVGFGFDFDYHHYGPYSEDLSISLEGAYALGQISMEWESASSGAKYAIFKSDHVTDVDVYDDERLKVLDVLKQFNSVVLELAATADYLSKNDYKKDPWKETISRKSEKANLLRIEQAKELLRKLGLS